jgi:hypothetical protein
MVRLWAGGTRSRPERFRRQTASGFALNRLHTNEFRGDLMLPSNDQLTICFAHVAYRLRERFLKLATGIESFE